MLPKKNKLNLSSSQSNILSESGFFWKGTYFHVRFDFQSDDFQMNVTVPKKNIFLSTQRNVWKRFLYHFFEKKTQQPIRLRFRVVSSLRLKGEVITAVDQELKTFFEFLQKKLPPKK